MVDLEKHDELKSWLKSTYDRVLLYVTSGKGLTYDDKIVTDVLKSLYLKLWESSESWNWYSWISYLKPKVFPLIVEYNLIEKF